VTVIDLDSEEAHQRRVARDWRLFGLPEKDLSAWMKAACWPLESAVAISLERKPENLSLEVPFQC